MTRYKKVCERCGDDNLSFEGNFYWDVDRQDYLMDSLSDYVWCPTCGDDCNYINVRIIELPNKVTVL
jgi:ribosomal protein S27AE